MHATKKSATSEPKAGDFFSRLSYGEIVSVGPDFVTVRNEKGNAWDVGRQIFDDEFVVATVYQKEEEVNQTELIQKITGAQRVAITVNFNKQAKHTDLVDQVHEWLTGDAPKNKRALSKELKTVTAGPERTMTGRHFGTTDDRGRIQFLDVENANKGMKLVDPRSVNWAIIEGVKYVVK